MSANECRDCARLTAALGDTLERLASITMDLDGRDDTDPLLPMRVDVARAVFDYVKASNQYIPS